MKNEKAAIGNRIIYLLIGLVGIFLMYSTVITTVRTIWLRSSGRETVGIVTRLNEEWHDVTVQNEVKSGRILITPERSESRLQYRAILSVETEEGTAEIRSRRLEETPAYNVGDEVKVLYFPGRIDEGQISEEITSAWTNIFVGLVGLMMFTATLGRRIQPQIARALLRRVNLTPTKAQRVNALHTSRKQRMNSNRGWNDLHRSFHSNLYLDETRTGTETVVEDINDGSM